MSYPFVTFPDADQFTYPKVKQEYDEFETFPMLVDGSQFSLSPDQANASEDEDIETKHPVIAAIQEGGQIESVEVTDEWTDDHCTCCNVVIVVNGKKYGFSAWWLSREGFKMLIRAESLDKKAIDNLKEFILSY